MKTAGRLGHEAEEGPRARVSWASNLGAVKITEDCEVGQCLEQTLKF